MVKKGVGGEEVGDGKEEDWLGDRRQEMVKNRGLW